MTGSTGNLALAPTGDDLPAPVGISSPTSAERWCEILKGVVRPSVVQTAVLDGWGGKDPADYIIARHILTHVQVLKALSRHYGCPFVVLRRYQPDEMVVPLIPQEMVRRFGSLPLFRLDEHLYVAMADPMDLATQDFLRRVTQLDIMPVVALRSDIDEAIRRHYLGRGAAEQAIGAIAGTRTDSSSTSPTTLPVDNEEAPAIKLINYIFAHAIGLGASDIHFEPYSAELVLRCRVDGILHDFPPPPLDMYRTLVSRVKVMAAMDISEKRLPQDGRMTFEVRERAYDLRVSVIPGVHGESVVVRILDTAGARHDMSDLGFEDSMLPRWERLIARPHGMILVTGPTGSGKSTTLYTTLKRIYTPKRKIVTLEDPVECHLKGITQFQINPSIGFTFAQGLRSVLRHDPDVIMLGEIRDTDSAEIALRSSLTGHLLFSTLHTNDASLALTRLVDMGIPPFLVLSSLSAVLAQRLLRRLCLECRVPVVPDQNALKAAGIPALPPGAILYGPGGCRACGNLGYRGRVGAYELLEITAPIRRLGVDRLLPDDIRDAAAAQGFSTLRESALQKLYAGITSLEEVTSLMTDE